MKQFLIRPTERMTRDVEAELVRLSQWNGTEENPTPTESIRLAQEWLAAYQKARASLAIFPERCALIPEQQHFKTQTRQLLFQRTTGAPTYRILFSVEEGDDGPIVYLKHLRHGARKTITRKEAHEL